MGIGARIFQAARYRGFEDETNAISEIRAASGATRQMVYLWREDLKPHYVALMEHAARHALKFELNYAKLVHQDAFLDQDENYRRFEQNMERFNRNRGKPEL